MSVSKFQSFETITLKRSQVKLDPENPRHIDKHAYKKLRDSLEKGGLVETLIFNKRTGELVGGHQRLSALDELHAKEAKKKKAPVEDYELTFSVVDISRDEQRKLNIRLNNPNLMGDFDQDKLAAVLKEIGTEYQDTGLSKLDLEGLFSGSDLAGIFKIKPEDEQLAGDLTGMKDAAKEYRKGREGEADAQPADDDAEPEPTEEEIRAVYREGRQAWRGRKDADESPDFVIPVVFATAAHCTEFLAKADLSTEEKFVDGHALATRMGIELTGGADEKPADDGSEN